MSGQTLDIADTLLMTCPACNEQIPLSIKELTFQLGTDPHEAEVQINARAYHVCAR